MSFFKKDCFVEHKSHYLRKKNTNSLLECTELVPPTSDPCEPTSPSSNARKDGREQGVFHG